MRKLTKILMVALGLATGAHGNGGVLLPHPVGPQTPLDMARIHETCVAQGAGAIPRLKSHSLE